MFVGCRSANKRPKIPPPPPPPALPSAAKLRLQPARLVERPVDTDFPGRAVDPSVLLVKRKGPENAVAEFHRANGSKVTKFKFIKWEAVELPKGQESKLLRQYKESALFERVEFQSIYIADVVPNDPLFGQQWDMAKIEAPMAWDKAITNDVIVAVMDTGIDFNHPDLQANLWTGPQGEHGYAARNGVITVGGADDNSHGTHVAGTIAAVANNAVGIAGVNWRTKVASFKFLNNSGMGDTRNAILCIEKMIELRKSGQNIRVSNNSWGGFTFDPALQAAFEAAEDSGIAVVCAAGNNATDTDINGFNPASLPIESLVSVLASDENDNKASFSNFGLFSTDLLAPGNNILSCMLNGSYGLKSGTSMATPHVAGAMAMMFGMNPGLTPVQAKTVLLQPESFDQTIFTQNTTAGGRLNLKKLWNNPALNNPTVTNRSPGLKLNTPTNFLIVPIGAPVKITGIGQDADGDVLSYYTSATAFHDNWWPDTWWEKPHFAFNQPTNQISVTTLPLALDQLVKLNVSVVDGRGGSDQATQKIWTFRDESKVKNVSRGIQGFTAWLDGATNLWFRLNVDTNVIPNGSSVYSIEMYPTAMPEIWDGEPNKDIKTPIRFFFPHAYSIRPFLIDTNGNFATGPRAELLVGTNIHPPLCKAIINTNRGLAPLEVVADLSESNPGSAQQLHYSVKGWHTTPGFVSLDPLNPIRRFTLTEPGLYELQFVCHDSGSGMEDRISEFFTVLPPKQGKLKIRRHGNGVEISWDDGGILQESNSVTGVWKNSENQSNPQTRVALNDRCFLRLR